MEQAPQMIGQEALIANREFVEPLGTLTITTEYLEILQTLLPQDWDVIRQDVWLMSHSENTRIPQQGFKIHVSATTDTAEETLRRVVPECVAASTSFKCTASPLLLQLLTAKHYARGGGGKFLTIYPADDDAFRELIETIHGTTQHLIGPYILSDRRYRTSKVVFYRYGGFRRLGRLNVDGTRSPCIEAPDGTLIEDVRQPFFQLPTWVKDPFEDADPVADVGPVTLNGRYRIERAVGFTNSGGIYLATDLATSAEVIVKEARPLTNYWSSQGSWLDATRLLRHEFDVLRRLDGTCVVRAIDLFAEWEHTYLVESLASGDSLNRVRSRNNVAFIIHLHRDPARVESFLRLFQTVALNLLQAVEQIHERGVVLGDLSPNNVFVELDSLRITLIDFESAILWQSDVDGTEMEFASAWSTPGFRSPDRARSKALTPADDFFALGMMLFSLLLPVEPLCELDPTAPRRFFDRFEALGLPRELRTVVNCLLGGDSKGASERLRRWSPSFCIPQHRPSTAGETSRCATMTERIAEFIVSMTDTTREDRLWPTDALVYRTNAMSVAGGACGTALFLERMGRLPASARAWLLGQSLSVADYPPGLYNGLSGIAYTFAELGELDRALKVLRLAHQSPLLHAEANVFQGAAGVGLAGLHLYSRTGDPWCLDAALTLANRLVRQASPADNGCIHWPATTDAVPLGIAYGASGVAFFLLLASLAADRLDLRDAAKSALEYDIRHGFYLEDRLVWGEDSKDISNRPYWLRGGAGIGAVLVRFAQLLGDDRYAHLAVEAARGAYSLLCVIPTSFEGLSGIGDLYVDMYVATGDDSFRTAAESLVDTIACYGVERQAGLGFPGRLLNRLSTSLGWGSAGIGLFLHRLQHPGPRLLHDIWPADSRSWRGLDTINQFGDSSGEPNAPAHEGLNAVAT